MEVRAELGLAFQEGSHMSKGEEVDVYILCWGCLGAGWVLSCPLPHSICAKAEAMLGWGCTAPGCRRGAVGVRTWT